MRLAHVFFIFLVVGCGTTQSEKSAPQTAVAQDPKVAIASTPEAAPGKYPPAQRVAVQDDYFGTLVSDPYRWLEDPDSPASRAWIEAQNKLTFGVLKKIPAREAIRQRLTKLWDFEKYGVPFVEGGRYFYSYNPGLLNQSQIFVMSKWGAEPRLLLDPNGLSDDGTVALSELSVSPDGKKLAYAISKAGSDWLEWRVRDVDSGADLDDKLLWSKFSTASWTADSAGFFYSAYDPPKDQSKSLTEANYFQKLYFHKLGESQDKDHLVYERKDQKEWGFGGQVTDDGRFLIIQVWKGTDPKNAVFYQDLKSKKAPVVELLKDFDALYEFVGNKGTKFYFRSDKDAPRGRLIAVDSKKPQAKKWREIVPQSSETLESVHLLGRRFIAQYLKDAHSQVRVFDLKGRAKGEVALPGLGSTRGFGGRAQAKETFFAYTSFTYPSSIFRYTLKTGKVSLFKQPKVDFDPADYETKQVFFKSKDGTQVPMFITAKKGTTLDGQRPTLLYGYGGFDISLSPWFSVANLVWMEMGGVYVLANLRGGNEYGEAWHQAGIKHNKQNVFDDFIAAAEWLQANNYTSKDKLAIAGGSNGGLLVGACLTQRPELFAAALPQVGVMDMLRYHNWTIGWAWASDYGTSADDAAMFKTLYAYSPYHNTKPGTVYPATLITTGDHDDRVVPAHSFKFAAALQHDQAGPAPVLIRIETRAGHGAGKPTAKIIEEAADRWAFAVQALGMTPSLTADAAAQPANEAAASGEDAATHNPGDANEQAQP